MVREWVAKGRQGVAGGESSKAAYRKAFQNSIGLRLEKLQQTTQFNVKEEGLKWELQDRQ